MYAQGAPRVAETGARLVGSRSKLTDIEFSIVRLELAVTSAFPTVRVGPGVHISQFSRSLSGMNWKEKTKMVD
jgi:hypothetical protein